MRQIGHLRRLQAEAGDVEQEEVVQRIGADGRFGGLDLPVRARWHQFGRNLRIQNGVQHIRRPALMLPGRHPADQVPDQGLRHPAVDIVVAHMVADTIGAPAQGQFRQVAGAQHEGPVLVGQPEQIVGAQARLHILEGDVVDRLAAGERVADGLQHGPGGRADVDLGPRDAQRLHQGPGVRLRPLRGREAGQGPGQNTRPRQAQPVEGAAGDQQGLGRIQPARDADHQPLGARRLHPAHQPLYLDVEGLVAVLIQPGRVVRHEGEAVEGAQEVGGRSRPCLERDDRRRFPLQPRAVREGAVAQPVQPYTLDVDVGDRQPAVRGEPLALDQFRPELVDRRLTVPGKVGGALAPARGGKDIGRQGPHRLAGAQHSPLVRLADDDVRGRQVQQNSRACERRAGGRRLRSPEVLTDLGSEDEAGTVDRLEDQARRKIHGLAVQNHRVFRAAGSRCEPALLIIFAVVGQIGLGHDAEHGPGTQNHGAVVEGVAAPHRCPDHRDHTRRVRGPGQDSDLPLHLGQQGVLHHQVIDGVAAQRQLRKDDQIDALRARLSDQGDMLSRIGGGVGGVNHRRCGGHADEAVGAGRMERAGLGHKDFRSSPRKRGPSNVQLDAGGLDRRPCSYRAKPPGQSTGSPLSRG